MLVSMDVFIVEIVECLGIDGEVKYRLGGKGFVLRLLRAIGSKDLMCSSVGPGICMDEDGSTSSESSVMPLNVEALRVA